MRSVIDTSGNPDNKITIINLNKDTSKTITLASPAIDASTLNHIRSADALTFSSDEQYLVYDALNEIDFFDDNKIGVWSIYALHIATETFHSIVNPTPNFDITFPAMSQTSNNYLLFDAQDLTTGDSVMMLGDLLNNKKGIIRRFNGHFSTPHFNGDDSAVIFSMPSATPTGYSLFHQALSLTDLTNQGDTNLWMSNADFAVIYRRGEYQGLNREPNGMIKSPASDITIEPGESIEFQGTGTDPDGDQLTFQWDFDTAADNSINQGPHSITFTREGLFTVSFAVTDSLGLTDSTPDIRKITVTKPINPPPKPPTVKDNLPNAIIVSPNKNLSILVGEQIYFLGSISDHDDEGQYKFTWYFDGAISINSSPLKEPGHIVFNTPGTYQITLLATNEQGKSDPTPASRTITVKQLTTENIKNDTSGGGMLQPMWLFICIVLLLFRYNFVSHVLDK